MNRTQKNIIAGLGLGLLAVGGVILIILLTAEPAAVDVLAEGKQLLKEAGGDEDAARKLEAEGKNEEADAAWAAAREKYDRAMDIFRELYLDNNREKNTRITAAYCMGLIMYSRGAEDEIEGAVLLLDEVRTETDDPLERFESCRVLMSYAWMTNRLDIILDLLRSLQIDEETLLYLNEEMDRVKNSREGRDTLKFFTEDHPELGLDKLDLDFGQFNTNDISYWKRRRMYRDAADAATMGDTGPAAVMDIFQWCCRNVVTTEEDSGRSFVSSPNQRLYAGHGTAEERAWVFCALLEALNYWRDEDGKRHYYAAMILKTGDSTLVSAYDGARAYLFDIDLCLPVFGPDGATPIPLAVARGAEENVVLNTSLEGVSYPYTSEDIRNARYLVPFNPDSAAYRQALLLPNDHAKMPLIHRSKKNYRPLYESVIGKLENAVRGHFTPGEEQFDYPYSDPRGGTLELWAAPFELNRLSILSGILSDKGPDSEKIRSLAPAERGKLDDLCALNRKVTNRLQSLQAMRRVQMEGDYNLIADIYKTEIIENPVNADNKELLGDATYFMGLALLDEAMRVEEKERGAAFEKAIDALQHYLENFNGGTWYDSARYHLAIAYLELGEYDSARAEDLRQEALNQLKKVEGSLKFPAKVLIQRFDTTVAN